MQASTRNAILCIFSQYNPITQQAFQAVNGNHLNGIYLTLPITSYFSDRLLTN